MVNATLSPSNDRFFNYVLSVREVKNLVDCFIYGFDKKADGSWERKGKINDTAWGDAKKRLFPKIYTSYKVLARDVTHPNTKAVKTKQSFTWFDACLLLEYFQYRADRNFARGKGSKNLSLKQATENLNIANLRDSYTEFFTRFIEANSVCCGLELAEFVRKWAGTPSISKSTLYAWGKDYPELEFGKYRYFTRAELKLWEERAKSFGKWS